MTSTTMTATSVRTSGTASTTQRRAARGHTTSLLTPVRAGDLTKVSARCSCGWRDLAVARTKEAAGMAAGHLVAHHVETAAPYASLVEEAGTASRPRHSLSSDIKLVMITVAIMAFVVIGGFDLFGGGLGGNLQLVNLVR